MDIDYLKARKDIIKENKNHEQGSLSMVGIHIHTNYTPAIIIYDKEKSFSKKIKELLIHLSCPICRYDEKEFRKVMDIVYDSRDLLIICYFENYHLCKSNKEWVEGILSQFERPGYRLREIPFDLNDYYSRR